MRNIPENELEQFKNSNFIMLFRENLPELMWLQMNHAQAASILMFICNHMDRGNALVCPSSIMEEYFDVSRQTISKNIRKLYDFGFIDILKCGNANAYIVNPGFAWTSNKKGLEYCAFNGKILINRKDNKDFDIEASRTKMKKLQKLVRKEHSEQLIGQMKITNINMDTEEE